MNLTNLSLDVFIIHGLQFGIEYVGKDLDFDIDESCVVVDLGIFRFIIGTGDYEQIP